ncbi:MAG TPA: AAA family ATPase [Clostridia bacterium]|nr:AAA family ATPase [Clostridia bacterium]
MKETVNIYKMSLALKSYRLRQTVDFTKLLDDIIQAKEEHNANELNQMALLKTHPKRINLLLKLDNLEYTPSLLKMEDFITTLIEDLNWDRFVDDERQLFEIIFSRPFPIEGCISLLKNSRGFQLDSIDEIELRSWVNEVGMVDEDTSGNYGMESRGDFGGRLRLTDVLRRPKRNHNNLISFDEALEQLQNMVGMDEAKQEVINTIDYIKHNKDIIKKNPNLPKIPYNYIIRADRGSGVTTLLKLMGIIFYHLEICDDHNIQEINSTQKSPESFGFREYHMEGSGITAIKVDSSNAGGIDGLKHYIDKTKRGFLGPFVVFIMPLSEKEDSDAIKCLEKNLNIRYITIPEYSNEELIEAGKKFLDEHNCGLTKKAEEYIKGIIEEKRQHDDFCNMRTMIETVARAKTKNFFRLNKNQKLDLNKKLRIDIMDVIEKRIEEATEYEISGNEELEQLIGLSSVKEKVKEITEYLHIQKQLVGLEIGQNKPNLHMAFTGNPGTGKTTVARIMGKILRELGLIKRGNFYEVSREDLVAGYIGHTALKTSARIREAYDSVLFIDEAYSLDAGDKRDFGKEAVETLIKEMEDNRHRLVVILAGYINEMEGLLNMNPGLRDRVPYKIYFPDYSVDELVQIFRQTINLKYIIDSETTEELYKLFELAKDNAGQNFGNGRFVRNVVDRVLMKQAHRLCSIDQVTQESLLTILPVDIKNLYLDKDIGDYLKPVNSTRKIGFM